MSTTSLPRPAIPRAMEARQTELPPPSAILLERRTAVIRVLQNKSGDLVLDVLTHLPAGSAVHICGEGFSSRTVLIRSSSGYHYVLKKSVGLSGE